MFKYYLRFYVSVDRDNFEKSFFHSWYFGLSIKSRIKSAFLFKLEKSSEFY